jgi:hypothetical protein
MPSINNSTDQWFYNIMYTYLYVFNVWECIVEEWFDLFFNDDEGAFYKVCYSAFS